MFQIFGAELPAQALLRFQNLSVGRSTLPGPLPHRHDYDAPSNCQFHCSNLSERASVFWLYDI